MVSLYRGDSWEFEFTVKDQNQVEIDLSTWKVRAELHSDAVSIKKANALVTGGSSDEVTTPSVGKVLVKFTPANTVGLTVGDQLVLEVEIESPSPVRKFTIARQNIKVLEDIITWTTK